MQISLPNVRIAFCDSLFTKKSIMEGKPQHSATFIMEPGSEAYETMVKTIQEVGKTKWNTKWSAIHKQLTLNNAICFKDGDIKSTYDGFEGNWFVSANNSQSKVGVFDRDAKLTDDESLIYAGCIVNGVVDVWAQDNNYGKRINARLEGVQFVRDGESFGAARTNTANMFNKLEPVEVSHDDEFAELLG
jgi:hypothetical protein